MYREIKNITVFCGSNSGNDQLVQDTARTFGEYIGQHKIKLIYGGAKLGIMGIVADAALKFGAEVVGVIPGFLKTKEVAHDAITEMIQVGTMHERKSLMYEMCDAVIALPGGFGTLDEFFEVLTWAQLGLHTKPVCLLNINGFFDPIINMADSLLEKGFIKKEHHSLIIVDSDFIRLFEKMKTYQAPNLTKWLGLEKV